MNQNGLKIKHFLQKCSLWKYLFFSVGKYYIVRQLLISSSIWYYWRSLLQFKKNLLAFFFSFTLPAKVESETKVRHKTRRKQFIKLGVSFCISLSCFSDLSSLAGSTAKAPSENVSLVLQCSSPGSQFSSGGFPALLLQLLLFSACRHHNQLPTCVCAIPCGILLAAPCLPGIAFIYCPC